MPGYRVKQDDFTADPAQDVRAEEEDLMRAVASGDRRAFETLVDRYMNPVFLFVYSICKNKAQAEDMTQETFLRLWRNAGAWAPSGRVKSWLMRIAHNLTIDELRKRRPQVEIEKAEAVLPVVGAAQDREVHGREVAGTIKDAILSLPERQRQALILVYYGECSGAEAAHILEITPHAFESLLARARKSMKSLLQGQKEHLMESKDAG